jgi:pimeloyl-ACP methyl ester carboxylesterase
MRQAADRPDRSSHPSRGRRESCRWTDCAGGDPPPTRDSVSAVPAISGNAQLAWEAIGEVAGRDVLLIHAGVTDRRSWTGVVERLSPTHRCLTYDARGYGETRYEPEAGWSPVRDALAVLDAAGSERACVVGASMGGKTALDLTLQHPQRVSGLVLIGSGVSGAPALEVSAGRARELITAIDSAGAKADLVEVNRLETWLWLDGAGAPERRVDGAPRELFLDMNGQALRAQEPGAQTDPESAWGRLEEIGVPVLVMVGELDLNPLQEISRVLAERIPGAQYRKLAHVAHLPHLEGDATTLECISAFIAGLD